MINFSFIFIFVSISTSLDVRADSELAPSIQTIVNFNNNARQNRDTNSCDLATSLAVENIDSTQSTTKQDSQIDRCLKNPAIPEGKWTNVLSTLYDLCEKRSWWFDGINQNKVAYKLRKNNGKIEALMSIDFHYKGESKNRTEVLGRLKIAQNCVQKLFARFGINLILDFNVDPSSNKKKYLELKVNLWDKYSRTSSNNWAILVNGIRQLSKDQLCGNIAHEVGHYFGLPDRYVDAECPDREEGPADSLMRFGGMLRSETIMLHPNDIAIIINPLCGK